MSKLVEMDTKETGHRNPPLDWKKRPCHFTWSLETAIGIKYKKISRNVQHDLKETPNLLRIEGLLFKAYLKVAHPSGANIQDARQALDEADECIERTDRALQNGYLSVALLNRMWIEHILNSPMVKCLLEKLDSLTIDDGHDRVIDAIKATALSRLGPRLAPEASKLFEAAVERFPKNLGFVFGVALMAGRQSRFDGELASGFYEDLDYKSKRLMDKERDYLKKMMIINDEYKLAQSYLGSNLCRRGGIYSGIGLRHLEQAFRESPGVQEVDRNLARYYRKNGRVNEAIDILEKGIKQDPQSAQHHHHLALCFKSCAWQKQGRMREYLLQRALESSDDCLRLDESNVYAMLTKADVLTSLDRKEDAKNFYETLFQNHANITLHDQVILYASYAKFLSRCELPSGHERVIPLWHNILTTIEALEYQDDESGRWQVVGKAKGPKMKALDSLWQHYDQRFPRNDLQLAILRFQNFEFERAEKLLIEVHESNRESAEPLKYLALTYLKWGLENAAVARAELSEPQEALAYFMKARESVHMLQAKELGLDVNEGRKLLADINLQIACSQSQLAACGSHCTDQEKRRLKSSAIESYRQAVRCGSLSSCLELLKLVGSRKENAQFLSRQKLLQILAEIDVCCSQRPSDCLQTESSRSGRHSEAHSPEEDCKKVKRKIDGIISAREFFGEAWKSHFAMEREILFKLFQNINRELEMDGRMEDPSIKEMSSQEIVTHATTCCKTLRELLDRIIDIFEKTELNIGTGKKHYFPWIMDGKDLSATERALQEKLESYFGIDMADHYPKLFKNLLKIQPGPHSEANFLKVFFDLVNRVKHSNTDVAEILELVPNPVALARQCTDKVEEICNYFFDTIDESKYLADKVERLLSGIKRGKHENAIKLLGVLKNNPDFVVRMGSTCKLLKVMALIIRSLKSTDRENKDVSMHLTTVYIARGKFALSRRLRQCHLLLEISVLGSRGVQSTDVVKKCGDTFSEAKKMLNVALSSVQEKLHRAGRNSPRPDTATETISFPLLDLHLKDVDRWKGNVKKKLKTALDDMGIHVPIKDKLLDILLKAQPCSSDDNYMFKAMFHFINHGEQDDNGKVRITTDSGEGREYDVLELTRWCTDNAERIAMDLDGGNLDNA